MPIQTISRYSLLALLAGALVASPADAQGRGKEKKQERARPELVRRQSTEQAQRAERARAQTQQRAQTQRAEAQRAERARADRVRLERARQDSRYDDRYEDRYDDRYESRKGPPFCQNGQGHPVHGREWCRDKGYSLGGYDRYDDDRYDDDRYDDRYGSSSSYERAHDEFHRQHDRQCRIRAAERPLDLQWQLRVRTECKQRHDAWHDRAGRRHS